MLNVLSTWWREQGAAHQQAVSERRFKITSRLRAKQTASTDCNINIYNADSITQKTGHCKGELQGLDNTRRSLAGPSSQRHGFSARPVQARAEVNKVAPGQVLLPVLRHSPVSIVPLMTQTHSILTLLSTGQRGLPKSTALSEIGKHWLQK